VSETDQRATAAEIAEIDGTLSDLKEQREIRMENIGDRSDGADSLTSYAEQDALIENLESRRQRLADQLAAEQ
jgi:hypothetical protein